MIVFFFVGCNGRKTPEAKEGSYTYYSSEEFQASVIKKLGGKITSIYEKDYQNTALNELEQIKVKRVYSPENPLFIQNPFGTNSSGLYVYLGENSLNTTMNYTISVEDESIPDFSEDVYINRRSKGAEGVIVGFLQGYHNKLVLEVKDTNGNSISKKAYYFDIPDIDSIKEERIRSEITNEGELTRGLFTILALDETRPHFLFYDNFGIIRSEIPLETNQSASKLMQIGNHIFYPARDNLLVCVNNIGQISNYYAWNQDLLFYDYDCDERNNKVLFLVGDKKDTGVRSILSLDLGTSQWTEVVDLSKILEEITYFDEIKVVDGNDVIVNSSEASSIVRINNVYSYPVIRWIMAEGPIWKDSKYEPLLLSKEGTFKDSVGQESVFYNESKKLKEGQYYLSLLNYNSVKNIESSSNSYYYKYLVDENKNQYELIQYIAIPYNTSFCMSVPYGNNVIISIGGEKEFREYNTKGEIISRYTMKDTNSSYQIYKYTMDRYWF